jgi:hypothetical protein
LFGDDGRTQEGRPDRPSVLADTRELVLRLARENPRHQRIVSELAGVGVRVSATSVAKIRREAGLPAALSLRSVKLALACR